ncbi:MAG: hypothetical protein CL940_07145 [Deltaproteobacteria bacterium]|nr:hypothetical protein [Deltaproteobacteria bacterium]
MEPRPTARRLLILAILAEMALGCAPGRHPCARAEWVDRVEEDWLVLVRSSGDTVTLRRSHQRLDWREGDAIVEGRVLSVCAERLRRSIRATREALLN